MKYLRYFEEIDFSGYIPEETRYKEVQNIVKDILVDLDEFTSIEWNLEELKSKYFPNVYVANSYDCVADLTITSIVSKDQLRNVYIDCFGKTIIERLIEVLNSEGFTIFEHSAKGVKSSQDIITNSTSSRFVNARGDIYKTFKICLSKRL